MKRKFYYLLCSVMLLACAEEKDFIDEINLEVLSSSHTGVDFENILNEEVLTDPFSYINLYNGGGVGIGDIDNDGLDDIILTGNTVSTQLYLNKGDMKFQNITKEAGLQVDGWVTSVAIADVNKDGWNDLYFCKSYERDSDKRRNQFFVNQKNGTFKEMGSALGIDDDNYSIGAAFFDYDVDGDLDLIVLNHPLNRMSKLIDHINLRKSPIEEFSSTLYRNDRTGFTNVTKTAGILSYGFCLGVVTSDYDLDGYPDIYITVDHEEEDLLFRNNADGTFTKMTHEALPKVGRSSMGIDVGDYNHDVFPDFVVGEMLPDDHYREKIGMSMQSVDRFNYLVEQEGYSYYQMRNFLHVNNGNGTFSDVAQMAKIDKSDWTWASFFVDIDNDSWQDVFMANGYYRKIYDNDRLAILDSLMNSVDRQDYAKKRAFAKSYAKSSEIDKVPNVLFRNKGNGQFQNISSKSGYAQATISTGAAYGDLDNDGDLDIVCNNIGEVAHIIKNNSSPNNNYLRLKFTADKNNVTLGVKARIYSENGVQSRELLTTRGYQGSTENAIHFGLGSLDKVDRLEVIWPTGAKQVLREVDANQTLVLSPQDANLMHDYSKPTKPKVDIQAIKNTGIDFTQDENYQFDDYSNQVLLPHKMSEQGPYITVGDVNQDGLDDFYVGAPNGQAGKLYVQQATTKFVETSSNTWTADKDYEDAGSVFVDMDGDKDLDLIVGSAGNENDDGDKMYALRWYKNDGRGNFKKVANPPFEYNLPVSCIQAVDFDGDGDQDVFVGGLMQAKSYPKPGTTILLENKGNSVFTEVQNLPFRELGMITDALWTDLNEDGKKDVILVGEWTKIHFYIQDNKEFVEKTNDYLDMSPSGWWRTIETADLDNNGKEDIIIGNLGLNYKYQASQEKPFKIYGTDIDSSGSYDIVLSTFYGDKEYPVRGKNCSSEQIPKLKEEYGTYHDFLSSSTAEIYGDVLDNALTYEVTEFRSVVLYQSVDGKFSLEPLPFECQIAPINGIICEDIDGDNLVDLVVAGNLYQSEIETGRADAGTGQVILNQGDRKFRTLRVYEAGLYLPGDVKTLETIKLGKEQQKGFLVGRNRGELELYGLPKM